MKTLALLGVALLFASPSFAAKYDIKPENSKLEWLGKKVTGKHNGTIKVKSGHVDFTAGTGEVVVDMTSITVTDLKGKYKNDLEGHLRSGDFFSVSDNNEAKLTFKKIKAGGKAQYVVTADLTIKGITKPISFTATRQNDKFKGKMTFDRTNYNIKYKSGKFFPEIGDKMIYDDVELSFEVTLKDFKDNKAKKKAKM